MRRGEIWWSAPSLPGGSRKRRPFLIVSNDIFNANDRYPKVLAVHLTSVARSSGPFRWEVDLPRGTAGLPVASIIKCAEVYALQKADLGELVGTLRSAELERVDRALALALDLPR